MLSIVYGKYLPHTHPYTHTHSFWSTIECWSLTIHCISERCNYPTFSKQINVTIKAIRKIRRTYHTLYKGISSQNRCPITIQFEKLLRLFWIVVQPIIYSLNNVLMFTYLKNTSLQYFLLCHGTFCSSISPLAKIHFFKQLLLFLENQLHWLWRQKKTEQ